MKRVFSTLFLALVLAVFAVGCGSDDGGSDAVPTDSVAVVGDQSIPKSEFEDLITYAKRSYDAQKRPFPKVGTPEYVQLRDQAMNFLIQRTQFEVKADELDIDVSDEAVDKRIDQYIKERHQGDKKKFDAELKSQGLSPEQARDIIRANLVQEAIFNKVTKEVKVTDEQVKAYYDKNKAQYGTPETRAVRHVLVKPNQKALADQLYSQLKAGGDWNEIAKKYSQDGLEEPGREDDRDEGPARPRVRADGLHDRRQRDLQTREDAVRLAHHPGPRPGEGEPVDAVCPGPGSDPAAAPPGEPQQGDGEVGSRHAQGPRGRDDVPDRLQAEGERPRRNWLSATLSATPFSISNA